VVFFFQASRPENRLCELHVLDEMTKKNRNHDIKVVGISITSPENNSKFAPEKWMVGRLHFPFGKASF